MLTAVTATVEPTPPCRCARHASGRSPTATSSGRSPARPACSPPAPFPLALTDRDELGRRLAAFAPDGDLL